MNKALRLMYIGNYYAAANYRTNKTKLSRLPGSLSSLTK